MIKRQLRIQRIVAVLDEYLAARTAADLLLAQTEPDPSYGRSKGWEPRSGDAFVKNLAATYIIRIYAEFEAGLRDYWLTFRKRDTQPKMYELLNNAIPTQFFPQDYIDNADDIRIYRNSLVHDINDRPSDDRMAFSVQDAKKHLCAYMSRLDAKWC